jgi:F0F1-type ATP synthase membrane subunit b/b'
MKFDSVIIWANILILILLLVKFAAKPFIDFIKGRKRQSSDELSRLETEKKKISGELGNTIRMITEKKALFAETEKNIIREAEKIQSGKIREAGIESAQILEKSARKTEQEVRTAAEKLRADVINEMLEKLPDTNKH